MPEQISREEITFSFAELHELQDFADLTNDNIERKFVTFLADRQILPDRDGYYPPKSLILDDELEYLLQDALAPLELPDRYQVAPFIEYDDICLQDFIVRELYEDKSHDLNDSSRTLVTVEVRKV